MAPLLLREVLDGRGPGHALLLEEVAPLLDRVERFVTREGRSRVNRRLPVRAALMHLVAASLVHRSAGGLREPLWGKADRTEAIARMLLLGRTPNPMRWRPERTVGSHARR
jgi:hypothetical protein